MCLLVLCYGAWAQQNSLQRRAYTLEQIIEDIYGQLTEDETTDTDYEQLYDDLLYLASHPVDINNATDEELAQLPFLTPQQRDDIRYFTYRYGGFHDITELQLINSLADYDIRNMEPFVVIRPKNREPGTKGEEQTRWAERLKDKYKHTATLRADYRSTAEQSPYYLTLRYQMSAGKLLKAGFSATKFAGEQWERKGFNHYGVYADFRDLNRVVSRLVVGDYRADYGCGLLVSSRWMNTIQQLMSGSGGTGLRARSSASKSGTYFTGAGITLKPSVKSDISVFYSFRHIAERDTNQHAIGMHAGYEWEHVKIGATILGRIAGAVKPYSDLPYTANYNTESRTITGGIDYALHFKKVDFNGETAFMPHAVATQNTLAVSPFARMRLMLMQRYYSPRFDNIFAHSYSSFSRINDEAGLYIGISYNINNRWLLRAYADGYATRFLKSRIYEPSTGFDYMVQVSFEPRRQTNLDLRLRWKRAEENYTSPEAPIRNAATIDKGTLRFTVTHDAGALRSTSQIHGTLALHQHGSTTLGAALSQSIAYQYRTLNLSAQLTAFQATDYDNRIYTYERDVLYAFSMPMLYGTGLRYAVNISWRIIPQLMLQLHAAQTLYAQTTGSSGTHPYTLRLQLRGVF